MARLVVSRILNISTVATRVKDYSRDPDNYSQKSALLWFHIVHLVASQILRISAVAMRAKDHSRDLGRHSQKKAK